MDLYWLFKRLLNVSYIHVENSGDYQTERYGDTLLFILKAQTVMRIGKTI